MKKFVWLIICLLTLAGGAYLWTLDSKAKKPLPSTTSGENPLLPSNDPPSTDGSPYGVPTQPPNTLSPSGEIPKPSDGHPVPIPDSPTYSPPPYESVDPPPYEPPPVPPQQFQGDDENTFIPPPPQPDIPPFNDDDYIPPPNNAGITNGAED